MLARTNALKLLYVPAFVVAVLRIYLNIVQPDSTTVLQRAWGIAIALFIIVYLGSSVIAMVHSYCVVRQVKSSRTVLTSCCLQHSLILVPV